MRLTLFIAALAIGCGPSFGTQSYWISSNTTARNYQEKQCNSGDNDACYSVGRDFIEYPRDSSHKDWVDHTYKLDPAKGKAYLQRACHAPGGLNFNACVYLADNHLLTADEMLADCKSNDAMCEALAMTQAVKLTDDQYFDLCANHTTDKTCTGAIMQSSGARYDELMVISYLDQLRVHAIRNLKSDDDDDAPAASSDNACHKDTDCKGDRICQAGDCVDAKAAPKESAPKAPDGPFKHADCDAFAALFDAHLASCAKATLGSADFKDDMKTIVEHWPKVPSDRRESLGARCSAVVKELEPKLKKAGC